MACAGYGRSTTLLGSNVAQLLDWGETDGQYDREAMVAGYTLGEHAFISRHHPEPTPSPQDITRQDILNIFARNPHWSDFHRDP